MATPITISIPHQLGKAEARRRLETGLAGAQGQAAGAAFGVLGLKQHWEGDCLHFEATALFQKMTGRLEVTDQAVRIELDLPAILAALADKMMTGLKLATQKLLEKR